MPKTERIITTEIVNNTEIDGDPEKLDRKGGCLIPGSEIGTNTTVISKINKQGGEAELYYGERDNKTVVIKYYFSGFAPNKDILEKLENLKHEDIINLLEYGTYENRFYEILENAAGGALDSRDSDNSFIYLPMSESEVEQTIKEVVNSFKFCHSNGIIHRDIKPGNIFYLDEDGTDIVIGDFGISSDIDMAGGVSKKILKKNSRTEGYSAPEIYSHLIGPELDYYSLGVTIFHLLTGVYPFEGRNKEHIRRDTIEGRVVEDFLSRKDSSNISNKFKKILMGLLTVRHDKRWGYEEVSRWLNGEDVKVFKDLSPDIPPFIFSNSLTVHSIKELSKAMLENKDRSIGFLYRGIIEDWIGKFNQSLALDIGEIKSSYEPEYQQMNGLIKAIFYLDPTLPFKTSNFEINTIDDILIVLQNNPHFILENFKDINNHLYIYIEMITDKDIVNSLKELVLLEVDDEYLINSLILFFKGYVFKPFTTSKYSNIEFIELEDLWNVPFTLRDEILDVKLARNSLLWVWIEQKAEVKLDNYLSSDNQDWFSLMRTVYKIGTKYEVKELKCFPLRKWGVDSRTSFKRIINKYINSIKLLEMLTDSSLSYYHDLLFWFNDYLGKDYFKILNGLFIDYLEHTNTISETSSFIVNYFIKSDNCSFDLYLDKITPLVEKLDNLDRDVLAAHKAYVEHMIYESFTHDAYNMKGSEAVKRIEFIRKEYKNNQILLKWDKRIKRYRLKRRAPWNLLLIIFFACTLFFPWLSTNIDKEVSSYHSFMPSSKYFIPSDKWFNYDSLDINLGKVLIAGFALLGVVAGAILYGFWGGVLGVIVGWFIGWLLSMVIKYIVMFFTLILLYYVIIFPLMSIAYGFYYVFGYFLWYTLPGGIIVGVLFLILFLITLGISPQLKNPEYCWDDGFKYCMGDL